VVFFVRIELELDLAVWTLGVNIICHDLTLLSYLNILYN